MRSFLFFYVSVWRSAWNEQPSQSLALEPNACWCLSGFSAAAAADRGQDVVRTSGSWSRCQTTAWCWSASIRSQRSYVHRYVETNYFIQRNVLGFMPMCVVVEGGQRAIIFNRIGGMQMNTVLAEGLHFRYHCWIWYFNLFFFKSFL